MNNCKYCGCFTKDEFCCDKCDSMYSQKTTALHALPIVPKCNDNVKYGVPDIVNNPDIRITSSIISALERKFRQEYDNIYTTLIKSLHIVDIVDVETKPITITCELKYDPTLFYNCVTEKYWCDDK